MLSFPLIENSAAEKILTAFFNKSGQFPNALLLWGPKGSGKRTVAKYLAAGIVCSGDEPPCGRCVQCRGALSGFHQDINILTKEKSLYTIAEVKKFVGDAYISPGQAQRKVMIIPDAHLLQPSAQNALLKTLEEPPENVFFILTALSPTALLPTVVSRMVQVEICSISDSGVEKIIRQKFPEGKNDEIKMAVACGDGSVGQAQGLIEDTDFSRICELTLGVERAIESGDSGTLMMALTGVRDQNREKNRIMLTEFISFFTSLLLRRLRGDKSFFSSLETQENIDMLNLMQDCTGYLLANVNTKLFIMGLHRKITDIIGR